MIIEKVINNNIVSAVNEEGREAVVMGRGIGFGAKSGDRIPKAKIEKIFWIKSQSLSQQFKELLSQMPIEHVKISDDIIAYATKEMHLQLNQSIYVTLTDHLNFAITRLKQGIKPHNALLWEIKRFYFREYTLGMYGLKIIKEQLGIHLPEDEAGFIALHFVNAEYGTHIGDAVKFPNLLKDILSIVKKQFSIHIDESSIHYERFVTHIKFLLQRIYKKEMLPDEESELSELMQKKYHKEYVCSCQIADYIKKETETVLTKEELMYLAIHIRRVTEKETK